MSLVRIRDADANDCDCVIDMIKELAVFQKESQVKVTNTSSTLIRDGFGNGEKWFKISVAELEERLVGFVLYFRSYSSWNGRILRIDDLYVRTEVRGTGIGTLLLKEVARQALLENCVRVHWNVLHWNENAKKFYEKCGAEVESGWQTWVLKGDSLRNFVNTHTQ